MSRDRSTVAQMLQQMGINNPTAEEIDWCKNELKSGKSLSQITANVKKQSPRRRGNSATNTRGGSNASKPKTKQNKERGSNSNTAIMDALNKFMNTYAADKAKQDQVNEELNKEVAILKVEVLEQKETIKGLLDKIQKQETDITLLRGQQGAYISSLPSHLAISSIVKRGMGSSENTWQFSDKLLSAEWTSNSKHRLIKDGINSTNFPLAYNFVADYFNATTPRSWKITALYAVRNDTLLSAFNKRLTILDDRSNNKVFEPNWHLRRPVNQRQRIMDRMDRLTSGTYGGVKVFHLWHGTDKGSIGSILDTGFAALAKTDEGFFGNGIYGAFQAGYAGRVYGKGAMLLITAIAGNIFPVVRSDEPLLAGHGSFENYDCHYIPVVPKTDRVNEVAYSALADAYEDMPIKPQYDEMVFFTESQVIPQFVVFYDT